VGGLLRYLVTLAALATSVALLMAGLVAIDGRASRLAVEAEASELAGAPFHREPGKDVVVITGSSTVRLWHSSDRAFPQAQVVNTGFGGSTMEELRRHYDGLIARFDPDEVYIGSGDNDLADGRSVAAVRDDTAAILASIRRDVPQATVAIIAAKPSVQRWYLRDRYEQLNGAFADLAAQDDRVVFVDVWTELLNADGRIRPELYASDGLHLNRLGYQIYAAAIAGTEQHTGTAADSTA
jgi:lysophospholipase L1-like esterase